MANNETVVLAIQHALQCCSNTDKRVSADHLNIVDCTSRRGG